MTLASPGRLRVVFRISTLAAFMAVCLFALALPAGAGTTGGLHGRVLDSVTGVPIAGAKVTAVSPSQAEAAVTDSSGEYVFLSLAPDTYTLTASKDGYNPISEAGITVIADQTHTVDLPITKAL